MQVTRLRLTNGSMTWFVAVNNPTGRTITATLSSGAGFAGGSAVMSPATQAVTLRAGEHKVVQ